MSTAVIFCTNCASLSTKFLILSTLLHTGFAGIPSNSQVKQHLAWAMLGLETALETLGAAGLGLNIVAA